MTIDLATREIVVEDDFPHSPATLWRVLTDGDLIARWIMKPEGFRAEVGATFTFQTRPAGPWDGTILCKVLEVEPQRRLSYSWRGGDDANGDAYGSRLDTVVTFTLAPIATGTRLRLVHSGFEMPRNNVAFQNMGQGWPTVLERLGAVSGEQ
jgi:uncharacterized protein YndB with AHSA1/START domain